MKSCPTSETVDSYLYKKYKIEIPEDKYLNHFVDLTLDIDIDQLRTDCLSAYDEFGWIGFCNIFSPKLERTNGYGGLSLVYNKNYAFPMDDVHAHTLGYPRLSLPSGFFEKHTDVWFKMLDAKIDKDFYVALNKEGWHGAVMFLVDEKIIDRSLAMELYDMNTNDVDTPMKNTYSDTYSFNQLTPVAKYKSIGDLTSKFKRSIIRSRLATLNTFKGEQYTGNHLKEVLWHRDCSWFRELRFNISITTEKDNHTIQLIDNNGSTYAYEPGHAYVWDTDIPHVQHSKRTTDFDRINLIYAVSPWFDYDDDTDTWYPNEFCQKKHPLDMLLDGDVVDMDFKNVHVDKATTH